MPIQGGLPAPDFTLQDENGAERKLSDFRGHPVVLYFYPKDDTPGCTKEACHFRDDYQEYERAGVVILGVSPDSPKSHTKFKKKYNLPFPLLCDVERQVAKAYGVLQEKSFLGKKFLGIERTTFLIDGSGKIKKIFPKARVEGHIAEVLAALQESSDV